MALGDIVSIPAASAGISVTTSTTAWAATGWTVLTTSAANPVARTLYGITVTINTPPAAARTTYEQLFMVATGELGSEATIAMIPNSYVADTITSANNGLGYLFPATISFFFPEPILVPANTRISVRANDSIAAAVTYSGIKLLTKQIGLSATQSATARITVARTKTQPATARIANDLTKTQQSIARLAVDRYKTQTAISRISQIYTKTQTAVSNIATDLTFTQTATASIIAPSYDDRYWVGGSGSWTDTSHWSISSGGSGGASVPSWSDTTPRNVIFDANSFSANGQTVDFVTAGTYVKNFDASGVTYNVTLSCISVTGDLEVHGSFKLSNTFTVASSADPLYRVYITPDDSTIATISLGNNTQYINRLLCNGYGDYGNVRYELGSDMTIDHTLLYGQFVCTGGVLSFNTNGYNVTAADVDIEVNTFTATGSTIHCSSSYFGNYTMVGSPDLVVGFSDITGDRYLTDYPTGTSGTFGDVSLIKNADGDVFHVQTLLMGTLTVPDYVTVNLNYTDTTFNNFVLGKDDTIQFGGGYTYTASTWNISGTSGHTNTLVSTDTNQYYLSQSSGSVTGNYVDVSYSNVGGGAVWYEGTAFTDSGNNTGWTSVAFSTKTQTAIARISNNITKTQQATARIVKTIVKTQTAISRIANSKTKTQSSTSRISVIGIKTQVSVARIIKVVTKTQPAMARIAKTIVKTQSAVSRIAIKYSVTQYATATIGITRTLTQSATARIAVSNTKSQLSTARISVTSVRTQTSTARIKMVRMYTQSVTSRVIQTPSYVPLNADISTNSTSLVDTSLTNIAINDTSDTIRAVETESTTAQVTEDGTSATVQSNTNRGTIDGNNT